MRRRIIFPLSWNKIFILQHSEPVSHFTLLVATSPFTLGPCWTLGTHRKQTGEQDGRRAVTGEQGFTTIPAARQFFRHLSYLIFCALVPSDSQQARRVLIGLKDLRQTPVDFQNKIWPICLDTLFALICTRQFGLISIFPTIYPNIGHAIPLFVLPPS